MGMPEPVESKPSIATEQSSQTALEQPQKPTFSELLSAIWQYIKSHFRNRTWAGWLLFIIAFFPDWQGRIVGWAGYLDQIGGHAAMLGNALKYAPPVLAIAGACYIIVIAYLIEERRARQWMSLAAWTVVIVSAVVFGSLALFIDFVQSSNIPAAMEYFAEKGSVRTLTDQQLSHLKEETQKVRDQVPVLRMIAERGPENLQYASELLNALKDGGLKFMTSGEDQKKPFPEDFYHTSQRGIMVGTKYPDAPTRPAILLRQAFVNAGLDAKYIGVAGSAPDDILLLIGPR